MDTLIGADFLSFVHPEDQHHTAKQLVRMMSREAAEESVDLRLLSGRGRMHWLRFTGEIISYKGERALLGNGIDITESRKKEEMLHKYLVLRDSLIKVNQMIMEKVPITEIFSYLLREAIQLIPRANAGSILAVQADGVLRPMVHEGFSEEEMATFEMPVENTFVYTETKGTLDRAVMIRDVNAFDMKISNGLKMPTGQHRRSIHSSISAPIHFGEKFFGSFNLDSFLKDGFDEVDLSLIEYLNNQLEVALAKYRLYEETVFMAKHDALTGTYNRYYMEEYMEQLIQRSERYRERFTLVLFDLNNLKQVNDKYGHFVGDEYITTFATTIKEKLRSSDVLARYGGDEFIAILLGDMRETVGSRMQEMQAALDERPVLAGNEILRVVFSYGVAFYPDTAGEIKTLLAAADQRMYAHKDQLKKTKRKKHY
jgi:diguanylate cyclase (GGDEF)-like protein